MNYLVTGGAGFIGSHIVEQLVEGGGKVRVLDNFSSGKIGNLDTCIGRIELIDGDVRDKNTLLSAVRGIDIIFHQAALTSVAVSVQEPVEAHEVNLDGTLNLLKAARDGGVRRLVFASSASVYGNGPDLPKNELMLPSPQSPYAVTKIAGEYYCNNFYTLYGLETVCLRYFNVFGPRQDAASEYSGVISKFTSALLSDETPVIFGDGSQSRDFVFVGDVVRANLLAARSDKAAGLTFNVGTAVSTDLNALVGMLNIILGKTGRPIHKEDRPGDIKHSVADIGLISRDLGYSPGVSLKDGLVKLIGSFR